jgi:uncharacterized glyoxalase superfamily protein PhnB
MGQSKPIPKGMHTVTPSLVLRDCAGAIQFYQKAFGAKEVMRMPSPDGEKIWHAELKIGDSIVFLGDEMPGAPARAPTAMEPAAMSIQLYVEDCDAFFARAVKAGAHATMKLDDMFWGDRMGLVTDPFGYQWAIATHQRDVPEKEMRRAIADMRKAGSADQEPVAAWRRAEDEERDSPT